MNSKHANKIKHNPEDILHYNPAYNSNITETPATFFMPANKQEQHHKKHSEKGRLWGVKWISQSSHSSSRDTLELQKNRGREEDMGWQGAMASREDWQTWHGEKELALDA